jgi:hypothetical protein
MRQMPTLCHMNFLSVSQKIRSKKGLEHVFECPDFLDFTGLVLDFTGLVFGFLIYVFLS